MPREQLPIPTVMRNIGSTWNRLSRLMAALVVAVGLVPVVAASPAAAASDKPTLLGFATTDYTTDIPDFIDEAGGPPAILQLFLAIESAQTGGTPTGMPKLLTSLQSRGVTAYAEVTTNSLDALIQGDRDDDLHSLAKTIGDWLKGGPNRHILIAPLPEMNLLKSTHPWGGDPSGYKTGYGRIRQAFLDEGLTKEQVRFVFAPNGTSDVGEYDDYYPGDATVDLVGFAKLNRGNPWRDYNVTFQMHIDEMQSRVTLAKPILITQTGSVDGPQSRDQWLDDMFTGVKTNDQVIGAIYFNRDKDHDYRVLVNGSMNGAFKSGYQTWSDPGEVSWIFDGRMDAWVQTRQDAYGSGFLDIQDDIFKSAITWLAEQKITEGCNPPLNTRFCPDDSVSRGEMAVFIARALALPAPSGDHFSDDSGEFYENAANRLYEAGITAGCGTNRYCGNQLITRDQMAAFLARTLGLPSTNTDFFVDDDNSLFEAGINKVAKAGITAGCNPPANDRYCPADYVTRGQMAAFLKRALGS